MTAGNPISRATVLQRSKLWVTTKPPYSQSAYAPDPEGRMYRTDCSGYMSMCVNATQSYSTRSMGTILHPIHKEDLLPGDFLAAYDWHVVLFVRWNNTARTQYLAREATSTIGTTVERLLPYPHYTHQNEYFPMRYNKIY